MSSLTDASNPSLLSPEALSVVRATAPVVAEHADQITAHFYPRMFAAHPELLQPDLAATGLNVVSKDGIRDVSDRLPRARVQPGRCVSKVCLRRCRRTIET